MARTYLRGGFALDIVSGVPWDGIATAVFAKRDSFGQQEMGMKLLRLPRLLRLSRLLRKARTRACARITHAVAAPDTRIAYPCQLKHLSSSNAFRVVLLMAVYVVISHWAACVFHFMSKWQIWNASSGWVDASTGLVPWLVVNCLQFSGAQTRYIASLYWALTTMVTVGFGDITPITNMERCFTITLQLIAGVLQGIVFGNIGVALHGFDSENKCVRVDIACT